MLGTHQITALARRIERLELLQAAGADVRFCDVADCESIPTVVEAAVAAQGKIDCLIYCAGVQMIKPMRSLKTNDVNFSYRETLAHSLPGKTRHRNI